MEQLYSKGIEKGVRSDELLHVMPTLLEFAGISHPGSRYRDREVVDMKGHSMLLLLQGKTGSVHSDDHIIGWELFSKRAVSKGDWKILYEPFHEVLEPRAVGVKTDTWQLYNLADDPAESNDLSKQNPEKLTEMILHWNEYVVETGLILPNKWDGY